MSAQDIFKRGTFSSAEESKINSSGIKLDVLLHAWIANERISQDFFAVFRSQFVKAQMSL